MLIITNKPFMLNVILLNVRYAECRYAECRYAECLFLKDLRIGLTHKNFLWLNIILYCYNLECLSLLSHIHPSLISVVNVRNLPPLQ
jgi:hypothetical protein